MHSQPILPIPSISATKTPIIYKVAVVLAMMTFMGGSLIGVMTYINLGYSDTFFYDWLMSFLFAAVTVMPAGFILMALLTHFVEKWLPNTNEKKRNIIVGLFMAITMESAMALSTAINNIGFSSQASLFNHWLEALLAALPLGLTLMIITSLTIKPKIERFLKS
ncbi:DUF2798 domain-containing protein [Shewanella inventionis]|uniref:DUF2798 domain-containing protein n=1 Tax=Shewanella inventionis TaxID=1738770 RepID=A0ABQ1JBC3_9GAMM|nr:DUF2798 domain-containing protein [Shewanella inventionis]MCL1157956.1 DUF2798 domain-containing protein [Shewanella inventionis]UAL44100.1 DUF2798 domain-containing protein [Shewanella inventionis]GGB62486.1 hypothetical protein GCM10011607_24000 [Shewanella inventionis]